MYRQVSWGELHSAHRCEVTSVDAQDCREVGQQAGRYPLAPAAEHPDGARRHGMRPAEEVERLSCGYPAEVPVPEHAEQHPAEAWRVFLVWPGRRDWARPVLLREPSGQREQAFQGLW